MNNPLLKHLEDQGKNIDGIVRSLDTAKMLFDHIKDAFRTGKTLVTGDWRIIYTAPGVPAGQLDIVAKPDGVVLSALYLAMPGSQSPVPSWTQDVKSNFQSQVDLRYMPRVGVEVSIFISHDWTERPATVADVCKLCLHVLRQSRLVSSAA